MANKILYNSKEAAQPVTMDGWLSADGHFWPNKDDPKFAEHHARWGGCTHKICECGNEHEKHYTMCFACRNKKSKERYGAMPFEDYNGQPVCIYQSDTYFFNEDDIEDYARDNEIDFDALDLVICTPNYMRCFDIDDLCADDLPEDQYVSDVAPNIAAKAAELEELILKEKPILSWSQGTHRTTYKG